MKLKFINLLLASVLLVGSAQVFTSCKDNEADLYVNLKEDTISLQQRLEQDEAKLRDLEGKLTQEIADRKDAVKALADDLAITNNELSKTKEELQKTNDALAALKNDLNNYATKAELENTKTALEGKISDLNDQIGNLNTQIQQNTSDIASLIDDLARVKGAIATIEGRLNGVDGRLDGVDQVITEIWAAIDAIKNEGVGATNEQIIIINSAIGDINVSVDRIGNEVKITQERIDALELKYNDLEARVSAIEGTLTQVQADINKLNVRIESLESFVNEWKPLLPQIQKDAAEALALAKKNANDIAALQALMDALQSQIELGNAQAQAAVDDLQAQIDHLTAQVENCATLEELAYVTSALQQQAEDYYHASIGYTIYMCSGLRAYIDNSLRDINISLKDANTKISELEEAIENGDKKVLEDVKKLIEENNTTIIEKIAEEIGKVLPKFKEELLEDFNTALTNGLKDVKSDIKDLKKDVSDLKEQIEKINDRIQEVATRINGILIQQTDNAVFGTLNLPLGINSNMLIAYAGQCIDRGAMFPAVEWDSNSYNKTPEGLGGLTSDELAAIGMTQESVGMGVLMNTDENGNGLLGTVYMTINPANIDLDGKKFQIVNSQNKALPVTIEPKASDKELNFGYTRANTSANGFFEADATISLANDGADLSAVRFVLKPELKQTVAEILKAPKASLTNVNTIGKLANVVYDQINGMLPAYGISASWTEADGQALQVTSQYGLAVATVNPLSLSALEAVTGKLPQIPNLPDLSFVRDQFDTYIDHLRRVVVIKLYDPSKPFELTYNDHTYIVAPSIQFDVNQSLTVQQTVPVVFDVYDENDPNVIIGTGKADMEVNVTVPLNDLITSLNDAIKQALGQEWADGVNDQINDQITSICKEISTQVNDMLASMQEKVDKAIANVLNDIQKNVGHKIDKITDLIGGYYNKVEALINRLNKVLDNPSYYVQPVLLYKNGTNVRFMSTSKAYPSTLVASVNDPGIVLVPTTYTLETAVPLYKKYVAVTHAWNADGTENVAARDKANNTANSYMNQVVPAQRHSMALSLTKGCTYEIIYQGLDYSGIVSGRKYYVTVK